MENMFTSAYDNHSRHTYLSSNSLATACANAAASAAMAASSAASAAASAPHP